MSAASAASAAAAAAATSASHAAAADRSASTDRLQFLLKSAHELVHTAPELSRHLVLELLRLSNTASVRLPPRLMQRVCAACGSILVPGVSSRASTRKCKRKRKAQRRVLHVECVACSHAQDFALPAKPSSRSVARVPGGPGQARAPGKGSVRQRSGSGTTGSGPPGTLGAVAATGDSTPTPTGGAMFGFDFVALC